MRFLPLFLIVSFALIQNPALADPIASASTEFRFQLTADGSPTNEGSALSALDIGMVLRTEDMKTQSDGENQDFTRIDTVDCCGVGPGRNKLSDGNWDYIFLAGGFGLAGETVVADFIAGADDQTVGGDSAFSTASGYVILNITADPGEPAVDLVLTYTVPVADVEVEGVGAMASASASASSLFRRLGDEDTPDTELGEIDISRDENGMLSDGTTEVIHSFTVDSGETVRFRFDGAANGTATAVPEPSSFLLLGMLGLIGAWRQRYSKSKAS